MATNKGFSDKLSPEELCDWLAAKLKANGLDLKEEERHIFLEDEINGLAFRKLNDADLKEMGFKRGPRKNILDIISSLSVETKTSPMDECDGTAKSTSNTPNAPGLAIGCTMNFSPKITPMAESRPSSTGAARGCLPSTSYLWPWKSGKPLVIELRNEEYLAEWGLTSDKVLECANRWSSGTVEGGNFIPKFGFNKSLSPDIIVDLNKKGQTESDVGYHYSRPVGMVHLDLGHDDQTYREHLIVHEFGHALGLGHEHQRSKLWQLIRDYIDTERMQKDLTVEDYDQWKENKHAEHHGATEEYDPDSVMHYWAWFLRDWLRDGYSNEAAIEGDPDIKEDAKKVLLGILMRSRPENIIVPTQPSQMDWNFLSGQYKMVRFYSSGNASGASQVQNESNIPLATSGGSEPVPLMDCGSNKTNGNVRSSGKESGPAPKRIGMDSGNVHSSGRGSLPAPKRPRMDSGSDDVILTINDLNAVIDALWDARPKWKDIGRCIGVDAGTLDTMTGSANDCLRETLSHWLRGVYKPGEQNSKPRIWRTLIEALQTKMVNEAAMANKLEKVDTVQDHVNYGATAHGPSPHGPSPQSG